jgi:hypothetical protein
MAITATTGKLHWNYFLALERDMESVSRYIEFSTSNFQVFSIELAHLLIAATSEVDVVAKLLCKQVSPVARRGKIHEYKAVLLSAFQDLPTTQVFVPRYGLSFAPWSNWAGQNNPDWWRSYNNVKHERDAYFHEATLKNALNALGALMIITLHFYARDLAAPAGVVLTLKDTTRELQPESTLIRLDDKYYHDTVIA